MQLKQFNARCPFVLPYDGKYYLYYNKNISYGCHIYMVVSDDLNNWTECECKIKPNELFKQEGMFLNPSVTYYKGKFYLTVSYRTDDIVKSVYIFISDSPEGEFSLYSETPLTPPEWECLGSSIFFDKNDKPYLIFSHEWIQVDDGTVCYVELSDDLKTAISSPKKLFSASEHKAVLSLSRTKGAYAVDKPDLYKAKDGSLNCLWSTVTANGYTVLVSKSDNGDIDGKWRMCENAFATVNGGHGMVFKDFSGNPHYIMHQPNVLLCEKIAIYDFIENQDEFHIVE